LPLPPGDFVAAAVIVAMMGSAQGYSEFVADLASHRLRLSKPQMVGVGGASPADQARLRRHEFKMSLVAEPTGLADCEHAFVYLAGNGIVLNVC
jgi:glycerol dehydrogenase-like iron-containing ADH family enzyme